MTRLSTPGTSSPALSVLSRLLAVQEKLADLAARLPEFSRRTLLLILAALGLAVGIAAACSHTPDSRPATTNEVSMATTKLRKPKTFTIDRRKWARGGENGESRLLNSQRCMCCLGFYAAACGVPTNELDDLAYPDEVERGRLPGVVTVVGRKKMKAIGWCMSFINDDYGTTEPEREKRVAAQFRRIGVTVKFTGPKAVPA